MVENLIPLFSMFLFCAGGLLLIVVGYRDRSQSLAQRVAFVQSASGTGARIRESGGSGQRNISAYGISDTENQQVIRMFSRFNIPPDRAAMLFTGMRLVATLGAGVSTFVSASGMPSPLFTIGATLAGAIVGWFVPIMIVKRGLKKHRKTVSSGLPDALELMAICVEAGLSLDNGLQRVAHELKLAQPSLAAELALTWAEISILPSRDQALENLAERVGVQSVHTVVGTLIQSLRFGSPLAKSLRAAAAEMRTEQLVSLEERANRLPALMTIPVMVLIMPTIFLIVGGPAVLRLLEIFMPR